MRCQCRKRCVEIYVSVEKSAQTVLTADTTWDHRDIIRYSNNGIQANRCLAGCFPNDVVYYQYVSVPKTVLLKMSVVEHQ